MHDSDSKPNPIPDPGQESEVVVLTEVPPEAAAEPAVDDPSAAPDSMTTEVLSAAAD